MSNNQSKLNKNNKKIIILMRSRQYNNRNVIHNIRYIIEYNSHIRIIRMMISNNIKHKLININNKINKINKILNNILNNNNSNPMTIILVH